MTRGDCRTVAFRCPGSVPVSGHPRAPREMPLPATMEPKGIGRSTHRGVRCGLFNVQWLLRLVHARGAISPAIVAPAANTNTAVSRRTTPEQLLRVARPRQRQRRLPDRPSRPRRSPDAHQNTRRSSLGRRRFLVASSSARGRHARSVVANPWPGRLTCRASAGPFLSAWHRSSGLPGGARCGR